MADEANGSSVRISNREVYDALQAVKENVYAIRLDITSIKDNEIAALRREQTNDSKRIRALELRFYGVLAGLIGAIAILVRGGI